MELTDLLFSAVELIGTVSFAVSGAMIAIKRRLDLFGVAALGMLTAFGGGVTRDVLLGAVPPRCFYSFHLLLAAFFASLAVFIVLAVRRFDSRGWTRAALLLVVMLLPYAWYFAAANHSYLHWWFTYRAQGVSVCALLLAVAALIGPRKAKIEK